MSKREKKRASLFSIFLSRFLLIIAILSTIFFGYEMIKFNILPIKYFLIIMGIMVLVLVILGILSFRKHARKTLISIISFLGVIYIAITLFGSLRIKDTISFMEKNLGIKFETNIYYVLVNSNSKYESLNDIKGETVYSYKDLDDMYPVEDALTKKVNVEIEYKKSIYDLLNNIAVTDGVIAYVNSGNYDVMVQNNGDYANKVKILDTIEVKTKKEVETSSVNVTNTPFVVLISGIDTRSNSLPSRSLADVNILMAVNPTEHKILLVHIPRDYYLEIPDTGGYKDKLTHTGTIGGIDTTIKTIENNFDIDISYYVRVNFNFVINLVDEVGGIDIYNDEPYSFTCNADDTCTFSPEWNFDVDGKCALAFARERYAYETGDMHRGENQQHVIEQLFDKLTSPALITNYTGILNSLNGTFETNLSNDDIVSLVKMQIDDMSDWEIEKYSLIGDGDTAYTYSYPNDELYVMIPDDDSMDNAIYKLKLILNTESD